MRTLIIIVIVLGLIGLAYWVGIRYEKNRKIETESDLQPVERWIRQKELDRSLKDQALIDWTRYLQQY